MTRPDHRHIDAYDHSPGRWLRHAVGSLALAACVISLALLLHDRYPIRFSVPLLERLTAAGQDASLEPRANVAAMHDVNAQKYRALGQYLARRYTVSAEAATDIVARA